MSYDLYRTASTYESSANAVNINPSLALPGYFSKYPALDHSYVEKPLPETLGLYSPREKDTPVAPIEAPSSVRTNSELAALVAMVIEEDRLEEQRAIEKVIIPIGTKSLQLLDAARLL